MDKDELWLEENTARLVQAAINPEARPTHDLRQEAWKRMLAEMRSHTSAVSFPDGVVTAGGILLLLVSGWLAFSLAGFMPSMTITPTLMVMAAGLLLNLILIPVAGIVIVKGRRNG